MRKIVLRFIVSFIISSHSNVYAQRNVFSNPISLRKELCCGIAKNAISKSSGTSF